MKTQSYIFDNICENIVIIDYRRYEKSVLKLLILLIVENQKLFLSILSAYHLYLPNIREFNSKLKPRPKYLNIVLSVINLPVLLSF